MKKIVRYMLFMAALVLASNVWADGSVVDCTVNGAGTFLSGDEFDGSARNENFAQPDAVQRLEWTHEAPGFSFETIGADSVVCLQDGLLQAEFISTSGHGVVNGVPGFNFQIQMVDNRPPPSTIDLTASITHRPTRRNEGVINFSPARPVTIPAVIDVIVGGSGNGTVNLILDGVICKYRGTGATYDFDKCNSGNIAGDVVSVAEARLKIKQADKDYPITSVAATISSEPSPGNADSYFILVTDADFVDVYTFSDSLNTAANGDIDIDTDL
jgi:hypothetical protein